MRTYIEEERIAAVELVASVGLAEAWRQTKIPKPTLVSWCQKAGVERFRPEQTRMAVEAAQAKAAELRQQLTYLLLEKAVDLLGRMDAEHVEFKGKDADQVTYPIAPASAVQNYATSAAILIDKYRLEMGEATGRTESTLLSGRSDHEQRILGDIINAELERRAHADANGAQAADSVAEPASTEPSPS